MEMASLQLQWRHSGLRAWCEAWRRWWAEQPAAQHVREQAADWGFGLTLGQLLEASRPSGSTHCTQPLHTATQNHHNNPDMTVLSFAPYSHTHLS